MGRLNIGFNKGLRCQWQLLCGIFIAKFRDGKMIGFQMSRNMPSAQCCGLLNKITK